MIKKYCTLLIVDDEQSIREGLKNSINWASLNIKVIGTAKDGIEAKQLINKLSPDIVITDIKMPNCDGLELIESTQIQNSKVKFIIISGHDDFKYAQKAIKYKVFNYLLKPIKKDILLNELKQLVGQILNESEISIAKEITSDKTSNLVKRKFFLNLISSGNYSSSTIDLPTQLNVELENANILILLFEYEVLDDIFSYDVSKTDRSDLIDTFKNAIKAHLPFNHEFFEPSKNRFCLVINTPSKDKHIKTIVTACKNIIREVRENTAFNIFACISNSYTSYTNLSSAYNQAVELLAYKLYDSRFSDRIYHSSIISQEYIEPNITTANTNDIFNTIIECNVDELYKYVENFFSDLLYIQFPPPSYVRGMCSYLVMDIAKRISGYHKKISFSLDTYLLQINTITNIANLKQYIFDIFLDYINQINELPKDQLEMIIHEAVRYIDKNINGKISIKEVANHVHLSERYFSFTFKKITGENFRSYILDCKIQQAKKLISTNKSSISNIAFLLGYENYRSFSRMFKNTTGLTPSEYQKQSRTK